MDEQLRRILNLVRKTGDRMVVTDGNGEDVYVVMGLEQYENLVIPQGIKVVQPHSRDELDDGLPSEASRSEGWFEDCEAQEEPGRIVPSHAKVSESKPVAPSAPPSDIWEAMPPAGTDSETWDISRMSDVEKIDLERQFENYQQEKGRVGIADEKLVAPVVEEKTEPKDEDFSEEQFYLEPID